MYLLKCQIKLHFFVLKINIDKQDYIVMTKFLSYICEKKNYSKEEAILVLHKIYGGIDNCHIEKENNYFEINVGQMIKDKNYKSLNLIFRKGNNVGLAVKNSDDYFYLVVELSDFSMETSRQDLLSKIEEKEVADKIVTNIQKFISEIADEFHEKNKETVHEIRGKDNEEFEQRYDNLIKAFNRSIEEYKKAIQNIDDQVNGNMAKQTAANMAKKTLKNEYFGENFKKFLSIINKLPEAKFISNLESETKKKVLSRLENYYDHYVEK
jgi:hypothetical protein